MTQKQFQLQARELKYRASFLMSDVKVVCKMHWRIGVSRNAGVVQDCCSEDWAEPVRKRWNHQQCNCIIMVSLFLRYVELYMPKFSIATNASLRNILQEMGITSAFENTADFSAVSNKFPLKVSKVGEVSFLLVFREQD